MSATEELQEHVHHAKEPFEKVVAASMAIIAALLAVVTVLSQHFNTERIVAYDRASDQWSYSEAKDIRHYVAQTTHDILKDLRPGSAMISTYDGDAKKYKNQATEIQDRARELERESDAHGNRADRFHVGEVFLELAIVLSSLCILTKRSVFFLGGALSGAAGVVIAISAYWA
jgi:hypothetical protein